MKTVQFQKKYLNLVSAMSQRRHGSWSCDVCWALEGPVVASSCKSFMQNSQDSFLILITFTIQKIVILINIFIDQCRFINDKCTQLTRLKLKCSCAIWNEERGILTWLCNMNNSLPIPKSLYNSKRKMASRQLLKTLFQPSDI